MNFSAVWLPDITLPFLSTVAIFVSLLDQLTLFTALSGEISGIKLILDPGLIVTVSLSNLILVGLTCVVKTGIVGFNGLVVGILIALSTLNTVNFNVSFTPLILFSTVIIQLPGAIALTIPFSFTIATELSDDL